MGNGAQASGMETTSRSLRSRALLLFAAAMAPVVLVICVLSYKIFNLESCLRG